MGSIKIPSRLSESKPMHLIAFWLSGYFSKPGELPRMILPANADAQRCRSAWANAQ